MKQAKTFIITNKLISFYSIRSDSAYIVQADLQTAVHSTTESLIQQSRDKWGRLDVLVNNASVFRPSVIGDIKEDDWNQIIQSNLTAPFFLSQVKIARI